MFRLLVNKNRTYVVFGAEGYYTRKGSQKIQIAALIKLRPIGISALYCRGLGLSCGKRFSLLHSCEMSITTQTQWVITPSLMSSSREMAE